MPQAVGLRRQALLGELQHQLGRQGVYSSGVGWGEDDDSSHWQDPLPQDVQETESFLPLWSPSPSSSSQRHTQAGLNFLQALDGLSFVPASLGSLTTQFICTDG